MRHFVNGLVLAILFGSSSALAVDYTVDTAHSGVGFRVSHLGLSWTQGRFNTFDGAFRLDGDPAKCAFVFNIKAESVDTGDAKRDEHLRSPDFFNSKQFPLIKFKSSSVTPVEGGFTVTGDMTMHGVTRPLTLTLLGGQKAEFPPGVERTGYTAEFTLKRSEFGMDTMAGPVGDEIRATVSFEGVRK